MNAKRLALFAIIAFLCSDLGSVAQTKAEIVRRSDVVSYAGPMEPLDLQKLVGRSELIVVGEVTRLLDRPSEYIREQSANRAKLYAAEITVREVLKGSSQTGNIIVGGLLPMRPSDRRSNGPLKEHMVRIFSLAREQNAWQFVDPFFGVLIAAPVTPRQSEASAYDKIMEQLFAALHSDLVSTDEKRILISYFRGSTDRRVLPALKAELEKPQDEALTNALLAELISRDDASALTRARKIIATSDSKEIGILFYSLARLNRPELLPDITNKLRSQNRAVRWMAATALADSTLPEADPPLLALLDDPDRHLVTQVMISLANKYGQPEWAPYMDDDKNWDDMLQHWRQVKENREATTKH